MTWIELLDPFDGTGEVAWTPTGSATQGGGYFTPLVSPADAYMDAPLLPAEGQYTVELADVPLQPVEVWFGLQSPDFNNGDWFDIDDVIPYAETWAPGNPRMLRAQSYRSSAEIIVEAPFDPVAHRWLRIEIRDGTPRYYVSPNGLDWTLFAVGVTGRYPLGQAQMGARDPSFGAGIGGGRYPIVNYVRNPSLETGVADWLCANSAGQSYTLSRDAVFAVTRGTESANLSNGSTLTRIPVGGYAYAIASGGGGAGETSATAPAVPGESWTLQADLRPGGANGPMISSGAGYWGLRMRFLDAAFAPLSEATSWYPGGVTAVQHHSASAVAPAGTAYVQAAIWGYNTSAAAIDFEWGWDAVRLWKSAADGPYIDGDVEGYGWSGTAHDSMTVGPLDRAKLDNFAYRHYTYEVPDVEDEYLAGLGYHTAQQALTGAPERPTYRGVLGWHGSSLDPRRGSYAIARTGGPLEGLVGERVKITAGQRSILAYVVTERDIIEDISLSRRAFARLAPLATDSLNVRVEVLGGEG